MFHGQALLLFILFTVKCCFALNNSNIVQNERVVFDFVFSGYNKNVRPVKDTRSVLLVRVAPVIINLALISEKDESLTYSQWQSMVWNDELLTWDPEQLYGITTMKVPSNLIWVPDLFIMESTNIQNLRSPEETFAWIYYDGNVTVDLQQLVTIRCSFKVSEFPFDKQSCEISYGSWAYIFSEIILHPKNDDLHLMSMQYLKISNPEWNVTNVMVDVRTYHYIVNGETIEVPQVVYTLKFDRKPEYYIWAIISPCFIITTISLIGLFTPNNCRGDREEKVTLGLTTLLTMAVMLTMVTEQMPKSNERIPLLGRFIIFEICLTTVCICITIAMLKIHENANTNGGKLLKWLEKRHKNKEQADRSKKPSFERHLLQSQRSYFGNEQLAEIGREVGSCFQLISEVKTMFSEHLNDQKTELMLTKFFDRVDTVMMFCALVFNFLHAIIMFQKHLF